MHKDHLPPLPPLPSGIYRHYKGNFYDLLATAYHSETREPMVVYRALYGAGEIWVRPAAMWEELVETDEGMVPRFTYIGEPDGAI